MKIIELKSTDSTNEYCKRVDCGQDLIVIAERQSGGKGTKGRSFSSEKGGLYLSVMRHYKNFPARNAFRIMVDACAAVCRTLEELGITPVVRWANDVLVNGRKICGTLIENSFSGENISRSIVGMGININNALPAELRGIATSVKEQTGKRQDIKNITRIFINNLQKSYTLEEYKSYINYFGKTVLLKELSGEKQVVALDIDGGGNLIVSDCGVKRTISAAEVSLRL